MFANRLGKLGGRNKLCHREGLLEKRAVGAEGEGQKRLDLGVVERKTQINTTADRKKNRSGGE